MVGFVDDYETFNKGRKLTAGEKKLNLEKTALILCDLQNDFLHPDGAYGRNGMSKPEYKHYRID